MSKIEETDKATGKGNAQVKAYQENQHMEAERKMTLHRMSEKYGLDANMIVNSGVEPHQLKEIIKEAMGNDGSGEFSGEKKQAVYAKLGYNIDGMAINVGSHISKAKGQDSGGNDTQSGGNKDQVSHVKGLMSHDAPPLLFNSLALNKISQTLSSWGITITNDVKEVLEKMDENDPKATMELAKKLPRLNREEARDAVKKATQDYNG
jgi:hypothetical protein